MERLLLAAGTLLGVAGIALSAIAVLARLLGLYWLGGFAVGSMLQAGATLVVIGCFFLLLLIARRAPPGR